MSTVQHKYSSYFYIKILHLSEGEHHYHFTIPESFLEQFTASSPKIGKGRIALTLHKVSSTLHLKFSIHCQLTLRCDRTLRSFEDSLDISKELIVKEGEKEELLSDEVLTVSKRSTGITLDQHIYDYISLALPIKCLHPDCRDTQHFVYTSASEHIFSSKSVWNKLDTLSLRSKKK